MTQAHDAIRMTTGIAWHKIDKWKVARHQNNSFIETSKWRQKYTRVIFASDAMVIFMTMAGFLILSGFSGVRMLLLSALVGVIWMFLLTLRRTRAQQCIGFGAIEYKRVIDATAITVGTCAVGIVIFQEGSLRVLMLWVFPVGLLGLLLARWSLRRWLHRMSHNGRSLSRIVVVGKQSDIGYVVEQFAKQAGAAYEVVGIVYDSRKAIENSHDGIPRYLGTERVEEAVSTSGADAVVVAGSLRGGRSTLRELSWRLEQFQTQFILVSSLTNVAGPRINIRPVEGLPLMHVDMPSFKGGHHIVKRAVDVLLSAGALLLLAPVFAVIAILIKREGPGPIFFSQERVGLNGETFKMHKFRSMVVDAEDQLKNLQEQNEGNEVLFKMRNDPRVTKVGAVIRKYSLDELPQIFNVLKGNMSLVGPRPPLPSEVAQYEGHTGRRLYIKPGLTGLWQVSGRSDLEWGESVRLDLYYVENWSLAGDIMIMWRTLNVILNPRGAY